MVQEQDEYRDVVGAFKTLEGPLSKGIPVLETKVATLGGPTLHAFRTPDGVLHVGTLEELRPTLVNFTEAGEHPAVILQIRELIGDTNQKARARMIMFERIRSRTGVGSARDFYEGSALRAALWERILRMATSAEAAQRILRVRSKLDATLDGGKIRLDLSALAPEDRASIDECKLVRDLEAEFGSVAQDSYLHDLPVVDPVQVGRVADILRRIERTGRQEERLAILLAAILRNRQEGMSALGQYQNERAKFARWAFQEVNSKLARHGAGESPLSEEQLIAELVPIFFKKQFPLSRGQLLFSLAKHLGSSPVVNAAIKRTLDRTQSMFVAFYREQIEEQLAQGRAKHLDGN
jgi:hypothetical protein